MKNTAKQTLLSLACTVILCCGVVVAQQANMPTQPEAGDSVANSAGSIVEIRGEPIITPQGDLVFDAVSDGTEVPPAYLQEHGGQEVIGMSGGTFGGCELDTCCAVCGEGRDCPRRFYVEQGTRILTRSRARDQLITQELVGGVDFVSKMSIHSLDFDIAAGYSITVGRYLGRDSEKRDHFLEFGYWGLNEWSETSIVNAENGFLWTQFPASVGGFNVVTQHTQSYQSKINNFELNMRIRHRGGPDRLVMQPGGRWRRECQKGCYKSLLFGIRGIALNEKGIGLGARTGILGDYDIKTHNNLVGLQIGGDMIFRHCRWNWGLKGKVGPFINFSDQSSEISINDYRFSPSTSYRRLAATKDDVALVAEFGFVTNYKLRPNLNIRAAYDLMWITGLALAPDQLSFDANAPSTITRDGSIYYHGLSLTAELIW